MRFKLLRYYSVASAIAVVAMTTLLAVLYDRYATDSLVTSVEQQNVILASFIGNDLRARFPEHFAVNIHDDEGLKQPHHTLHIREIDAVLKDLLKSLPVLKVNAYRNSLTIYSTEHSQIGGIKSSPDFLITRNQGIPVSKLSFRSKFNTLEGVVLNRDIVETYVPVGTFETMTGNMAWLIFEIYTDVTQFVTQIERSKNNLIAGLIILFAALYGVLVLIVRRADRVIDQQYDNLRQEIAERLRAEKASERLSHAIESVPVGIALFDEDDRLIFCNNQYREVMDVMADILKPGIGFEEILRTIVARQPLAEAQGREEDYIRERLERHRNPGPPIELHRLNGEYLAHESRTPGGGIFIIITDVTELKRADEARRLALLEAEHATQVKSEFLANMSHELRTPLNAIIGFSDMIKGAFFGPIETKYLEYATDINQSGNHLLGIVSDILDLSKVEAGELDIEKEEVDVAETVSACIKMVSNRHAVAGVTLTLDVEADLAPLFADPLRLKQVLLNLISNAIKFTPDGGQVTITGETNSDGGVALAVRDTGIGIAKEDIPMVVEKFGQIRDGHMQAHQGAGLGLALAKSLMDRHGGTLRIESEVGKGTTVTVSFPHERTV